MITELIDLLTCHQIDSNDLSEITRRIANADEDPEFSYAPSECVTAVAIISLLDHAMGDKIDEVHEQIQASIQAMSNSPFPDYPYELVDGDSYEVLAYFKWLDHELSQLGEQKDSYDLIELSSGLDDSLDIFIVYRKDIKRILQISETLDLGMVRPLDAHLAIAAMGNS